MPDSYLNIAIKRQAMLERLKSAEVRDYLAAIKGIDQLIKDTIFDLDEELEELPRTRLNSLLSKLQKEQGAIFQKATAAFLERQKDVATLSVSRELIDLTKTVDVRKTWLKPFTNKDLYTKVIQRPLSTDGDLLEPWIKKFTDGELRKTSNIIRNGHAQGLTNKEMVNQIVGTSSQNFLNGDLARARRNASTIVRTSVQHVASSARQEVWEANRDIIGKYEFVATLDRVTSNICRSLDGQEFEFGKGPIPPVHPNCRSTTIPILNDEFSFLSKGRTRSAEFGPVTKEDSYYDWLKKQDKKTQKQVLGTKRTALLRDGGLTAERFRELQLDKNFLPMTLEEMRELEPEAFKMAGL